jgi:predicted kinase
VSKIAYFLLGVSGSGKSTIVKHLKKQLDPKLTVATFSHDNNFMDFKAYMHCGQWWSDLDSDADMYKQARDFAIDHKDFSKFENEAWAEALTADVLFIDTMHVSRKKRAKYLNDARAKKFTVYGIQMMTTLKTLLDRQHTRRDKVVPESVIRDAYFRQEEFLVPSEVDLMFVVDGTAKEPVLHAMVHFA